MIEGKQSFRTAEKLDENLRRAYERGEIYKVDTICNRLEAASQSYADRLLADKLETVRRHVRKGLLVDLCCATGAHVLSLADAADECLGIDFSRPFIEKAKDDVVRRGVRNVRFEVGDAKELPLASESVATLYSLSSLYQISDVGRVFSEIGRVLRPGGRCILDLGGAYSLNAICLKYYVELPPVFLLTIDEIKRYSEAAGLTIIEHRRFQLLPLWADRPKWLYPLLHPAWKRVMALRIGKRMLDEWLSSLPILRNFAFRHLIVCEKLT